MSEQRPNCKYLDCPREATTYVTWQMHLGLTKIGKPTRDPYCGIHAELVEGTNPGSQVEPLEART